MKGDDPMTTKFLITALVAGLLIGLAFAGTDLLNPRTAAAKANRMNIDAQHQQAMYELEERLSTAQTEAEVKEIQRQEALLDAQYQHDIQALSQDLAHQDLAFRTWMTVFTIFAGAIALTLFISVTTWMGSRAWAYIQSIPQKEERMPKFIPPIEKKIPNLPERESYEPLDQMQILFANRLNERLQEIAVEREGRKEAELLAKRIQYILRPARMSSEEYNKLPLAH